MPDDVRAYLKAQVAKAYANLKQIQLAHIEGVPYSPVGFVFEIAGEMHPAPETCNDVDGLLHVKHLAYFWAVPQVNREKNGNDIEERNNRSQHPRGANRARRGMVLVQSGTNRLAGDRRVDR